jgi:hypothetical protein
VKPKVKSTQKNVSDAFFVQHDLKETDALLLLLFNLTLDYAIRKVQENKKEVELSGKDQVLVYVVNVTGLGENIYYKIYKFYYMPVRKPV